MKEDYLHAIESAGFRDVRIIDETLFPIQDLVSHPAAKDILVGSDGLQDAAEQLAASIVSIKVSALKAQENAVVSGINLARDHRSPS